VCLNALVTALVIALASGCSEESTATDDAVTVYFSSGLRLGSTADQRGMQLALDSHDGRAGGFRVELVALDSSSDEVEGRIDSAKARRHARRAVSDPRAVAYVGEDDSATTVESIPITNRGGLLQVSYYSTYVGLTRREGAERGEPDRYYPSGKRTFARLLPHDNVQADAMAEWIRREGHRRVVTLNDGRNYGVGLERAVRTRLPRLGIEVVNSAEPNTGFMQAEPLAELLRRLEADAVVFAGGYLEKQFRDLADRVPDVAIYAGDSEFTAVAEEADALGEARDLLRVTYPLPPGHGPGATAAAEMADRFEQTYGEPPSPAAIRAYETMDAILDAIERAGDRGNDRGAVLRAFMTAKRSSTSLGSYRFDRYGDITGQGYGGYMAGPDGAHLVTQLTEGD
jgi:branched-chain amino acid transport system substrate-binding protein